MFTDRSRVANGEVTVCCRYELLEGGCRLRAAEQVRGAGRDQDNPWVFERSAQPAWRPGA